MLPLLARVGSSFGWHGKTREACKQAVRRPIQTALRQKVNGQANGVTPKKGC